MLSVLNGIFVPVELFNIHYTRLNFCPEWVNWIYRKETLPFYFRPVGGRIEDKKGGQQRDRAWVAEKYD